MQYYNPAENTALVQLYCTFFQSLYIPGRVGRVYLWPLFLCINAAFLHLEYVCDF